MRKLDKQDKILASVLFPQIIACFILLCFAFHAAFTNNKPLAIKLVMIVNIDTFLIFAIFQIFKKKLR